MRTTVNLSEHAYQVVRELAFRRRQPLGEVISELILQEPRETYDAVKRPPNKLGIVTIDTGNRLTVEQAKELMDEDE